MAPWRWRLHHRVVLLLPSEKKIIPRHDIHGTDLYADQARGDARGVNVGIYGSPMRRVWDN